MDSATTPQLDNTPERPSLEQVTAFLDSTLQCAAFAAADAAANGLQVGDARRSVGVVAAAVDASLESLERAADLGADLLLVHHGILWGQCAPLTGPSYRRLALLVAKDLALYAAHLPLDAHLQYGNNIHLAERLGLEGVVPFGSYKGQKIGCGGEFSSPCSADEIRQRLRAPENGVDLRFGRSPIAKVAIVCGAGALAIEEAAAEGYQLLLTGEIAHQHYHLAKELGLSILAIGHYRSEMGGVQRLLALLQRRWPHLATDFIDLPTGL